MVRREGAAAEGTGAAAGSALLGFEQLLEDGGGRHLEEWVPRAAAAGAAAGARRLP